MGKKSELFRNQFSIGSRVDVFLPNGKCISGMVVEMDEDRVTLDDQGQCRTFFFEFLAGWTGAGTPAQSSLQKSTEEKGSEKSESDDNQEAVEVNRAIATENTARDVQKEREAVSISDADAETRSVSVGVVPATIVEPRLFEIFRREVDIAVPSPVFLVEELDSDERQELNRWKNKYDYAVKIQEFSRVRQLVPEVLRLGERTRRAELWELAGILALQVDLTGTAETALTKCGARPDALVGLARIAATKKDWNRCARHLVDALSVTRRSSAGCRRLLESLGQAIARAVPREIQGLACVVEHVDPSEQALALLVLGFALSETKAAAANAVIRGDLETGRQLAADSPVFQAVLATQKRDVKPPPEEAPPATSAVRFGRVSAVVLGKGTYYGFIRDDATGGTYYLHLNHTQDADLASQLLGNRCGQRVQFSPAAGVMPGRKYPVAFSVQLAEHPSAVSSEKPSLPAPRKIAPAVLLRAGDYGQAKREELVGNLDEAERLYAKAICHAGRYRQSAVMDLATLIHRRGRTAEAVELMDRFSSYVQNATAVANQKIAFWLAAKDFARAADIIRVQIKSATPQQRAGLLRQLVYCHFALGNFAEALKVLRTLPQDNATLQMISRIEQAQRGGPVATPRADAVSRELSQWTSGLSPFARYLLQNSDDRYLDERSKARGYFDEQDFKMLQMLFDGIRGRRPLERGRILLTIATLCQRAPEAAGDRQLRSLMRRVLILFGQAAFIDCMNPDVARAYFIEAASLSSEDEVMHPLAHLLATYLTEKPAVGSLERDDGNVVVRDVLDLTVRDEEGWARFEADFVYYSAMSGTATRVLQRQIRGYSVPLRQHLMDERSLEQERDGELERLRREQEDLAALESLEFVRAQSFVTAAQQLYGIGRQTRFQTDRRRTSTLGNICTDGASYLNEQDYVEREGKYLRLSQGLARFREEIVSEPTKLSVELLLPLVDAVADACRRDFEMFTSRSRVSLVVSNVLHNDYYIPDHEGCLRVCLAVESAAGGAPIEGLELTARADGGLTVVEAAVSPEILRGGQRREVEVLVRPTSKQLEDRAFTLDCLAKYRNRAGEAIEVGGFGIPVRIGVAGDFQEIKNPYRNYAGGRSVDEPNMFKGREDVLGRIIEVVTSSERGQCFVLYGQKRSGKTSILRQLKQRIPPPFLPVDVTVGALEITSKDKSNFMQLCVDQLHDRIIEVGGTLDETRWPSSGSAAEKPLESLRIAVRGGDNALSRLGWEKPCVVFLIDEFTYLYEYITEGVLAATFMRQWKSMLEMQLFNAIVVGQDSMPLFKQAFPNEFGVTFDERITYLSDGEARRLAVDPISLENESRYRGYALDRLLALTAGNPFYMQIFCDRLVRHLNERKAPFITEADVEIVSDSLAAGEDALPMERFDPLITAAAESVAQAPREAYLRVLTEMAVRSDASGGARPGDLPDVEGKQRILADMEQREVVQVDASGRFAIRVKLFEQWLKAHADVVQQTECLQ